MINSSNESFWNWTISFSFGLSNIFACILLSFQSIDVYLYVFKSVGLYDEIALDVLTDLIFVCHQILFDDIPRVIVQFYYIKGLENLQHFCTVIYVYYVKQYIKNC